MDEKEIPKCLVMIKATGEIIETYELNKTTMWQLKCKPKKNHKKCLGRGYKGRAGLIGLKKGLGHYIPCECTMK